MILEVFDKQRNRVAMIKQYSSAEYTVKFNGVGTFTISVNVNDDSIKYLVINNYILLDAGIMGIIKRRSKINALSTSMTINGYMISHVLSYRTFIKTQVFSGTVEEIIEQMMNNNFINPQDIKRKIDFIKFEKHNLNGESKKVQNTGGTVEEAIESVLLVEDKGFSFEPEIAKYNEDTGNLTNVSNFILKILEPVDRSFNNKENNNPIVFSVDLNNLEELSFEEDGSDYKNLGIVAGAGEGEERIILEVGALDLSGIDRQEVYIDVRDLSKTKYENNVEVIIPDNEYQEMLNSRGNERLKDYELFLDLDGKIVTQGQTVNNYGKDYFLGDYVTVIDNELGYMVNAQITEFKKTISNGTEKNDLTFGYQRESLRKILKKRGAI